MGDGDERAPGYQPTVSFLGTDAALWWKCDRSRLKLFSVDFLPCRQR